MHSNEPPVFPDYTLRAGPSGTNNPDPNARRAQIDSSDEEDEPVRPVWPPPDRSRKRRNPFILDEAKAEDGGEGTCPDNEREDEPEDGTYDGFYVNDDIFD